MGGTIHAAARRFPQFNERDSPTYAHLPVAITKDGQAPCQGRRVGALAPRAAGARGRNGVGSPARHLLAFELALRRSAMPGPGYVQVRPVLTQPAAHDSSAAWTKKPATSIRDNPERKEGATPGCSRQTRWPAGVDAGRHGGPHGRAARQHYQPLDLRTT